MSSGRNCKRLCVCVLHEDMEVVKSHDRNICAQVIPDHLGATKPKARGITHFGLRLYELRL